MAIRTVALGGTDWTSEILDSADLNDTIAALWDKVKTLTCFWLNSDLYDVYDDFNSYSTAAFPTNSKWTITGTANITATTNAGGDTKELQVIASHTGSGSATSTAKSILLADNKHTFARLYASTTRSGVDNATTGSGQVRFGNTGSYFSFLTGTNAGTDSATSSVMVINTGTDAYDLYLGGKVVASYTSVAAVDAQLEIRAYADGATSATQTTYVYCDDVRQSK